MKKFIILFLMLCAFCIPTILVSESVILVRSVAKENVYVDFLDYLIPRFLARARISIYGLRSCSDVLEGESKPHNLVNFLSAAHSDSGTDREIIRKYLKALQKNGCSFEAVDVGGLPVLHGAILFNDFELVKFFVENGANLNSKVQRQGKKSHGKNAIEFAQLLLEVEPDVNREPIIKYLATKI